MKMGRDDLNPSSVFFSEREPAPTQTQRVSINATNLIIKIYVPAVAPK